MKKSIYIVFLALSAFLLSCSRIEIDTPVIEGKVGMLTEGLPTDLTLCVEELDYIGGQPLTKATTDDEKKISNIWILQFNGTLSESTLVSAQFAAIQHINKVFITPITATNRIVILANYSYRDDLAALAGNTTFTYDSLLQMTLPTDEMVQAISDNGGVIPMCGQSDVKIPDQGEIPSVEVHLTRTVAKIQMDITSSLSDYTLDQASVCNVPEKSYYFPNFEAPLTTEYPIATTARTNYYSSPQHNKAISSGNSVVFYVPINIQGSVSSSTSESLRRRYAPSDATFITLRGRANSGDLQKNGGLIYYHKYIGANQTSDYNVLPNHCYTYNYNIVGSDPSGTNSNIEKSEIRNCYIMVPTKEDEADRTVTIDVAEMVNRYWKQESDKVHPNDVLEMVNIWSEGETSDGYSAPALSNLTFSRQSGTTKFSTIIPRNTYGNYLVAVKKNGKTLWSYHIWCPELSPEDNVRSLPSSKSIMQMNLGALWRPNGSDISWGHVGSSAVDGDRERSRGKTMGLYYQWGRKDPFRSFNNPESTTSQKTIEESVMAPQLFVNRNDNWCSDDNNKQWNNSSSKTIHDPCPIGWKVPDADTWDGVSNVTENYKDFGGIELIRFVLTSVLYTDDGSSDSSYLPLPGTIDPLGRVGNNRDNYKYYVVDWIFVIVSNGVPDGCGVYWNNTNSSETNGSSLRNDKNGIGLNNSYPKSTGASIRCQKM